MLVVDDGSSDRTAEVAATTAATVLRLPFNLGVGGAVRLGFLYAVRHGYSVVVQVDSDGQHDPAYIPELVSALATCDVVVGSRFAGGGTYDARGPRRWAMRILAAGVSPLCRAKLTDVTSGFRAVGPRGVPVFARDLPAEYLGDTVEALVLAHRAGLVVSEISVQMRQRSTGKASQGPFGATAYLARAFVMLAVAATRRAPVQPALPATGGGGAP